MFFYLTKYGKIWIYSAGDDIVSDYTGSANDSMIKPPKKTIGHLST